MSEGAQKEKELAGKAEVRVITTVLRNSSKRMKLASCYWTENKDIITIQIVCANNHAYLMLTGFADPS